MDVSDPGMLQTYVAISPYLDEAFYLKQNFDLRNQGIDPVDHYIRFGWREGRNPSPGFNTLYYIHRYFGDFGDSPNPLLHYINLGRHRHYSPAPDSPDRYLELQRETLRGYFDAGYYRRTNPDLALDDDELLDHFLVNGWKEGRNPCAAFDTNSYVAANPVALILDINPFFHYVSAELLANLRSGEEGDGRSLNVPAVNDRSHPSSIYATIESEFDRSYYLQVNSDVREADNDPVQHYIEYGWREGRNPSPTFFTSHYLDANPDVRESGTNPFYHFLVYGRTEGRKPNPVGTPLLPRPLAPPDEIWATLPKRAGLAEARVEVVIPVYRGYDDTLACVAAVLRSGTYEVVVINDRGPEEKLNRALEKLGAEGYFTYIVNDLNLGFVGTANKGLQHNPNRDVILLNSDTVVFPGWADRILAHADADPAIGTITPFSNSATVCSYPLTDRDNIFQLEATPSDLDIYAAACNAGLRTEVPSGVGFCMYVRRALIDTIGLLDEKAFGRGYGEENDYCIRAAAAGYKNVFIHDVFVQHSGETSFQAEAGPRRAAAQQTLARMHPSYHPMVRRHIRADPARFARRRLDAYRFAQAAGREAVVFVTHNWGGGIERHIDDLGRALRAEGKPLVRLRITGAQTAALELTPEPAGLYLPNLGPLDLVRDAELVADLLRWMSPRLVHIHAVAGLSDQATDALFTAIEASAVPYAYTWHDVGAMCHRNHFVTADGHYCGGVPAAGLCGRCLRADNEATTSIGYSARRGMFTALLGGATQIIAPSEAAAVYARAFTPDKMVTVRPHPEHYDAAAWIHHPPAPPPQQPLKVAILGAIGPHKGSDLIHAQLIDAQARGLPIEFMLIGHSDQPELKSFAQFRETGRYDGDAEAFRHLHEMRPHLCYFPSIWPETFCYSLSLAFAAGIPPVVFGLGAQGERVAAAGWGQVLPAALTLDPAAVNDRLLAAPVADLWAMRKREELAAYGRMFETYYEIAR